VGSPTPAPDLFLKRRTLMDLPKKIYKYVVCDPLQFATFTIDVISGFSILKLGLQEGSEFTKAKLVCWAEVYPKAEMVAVKFHVIPTGFSNVPENGRYIGTVQCKDLVYHCYWE
jgi:hypothetical protein